MSGQFHTQATLLQHNGQQIFNKMPGGRLCSPQQVSIRKTATPAQIQAIGRYMYCVINIILIRLKGSTSSCVIE